MSTYNNPSCGLDGMGLSPASTSNLEAENTRLRKMLAEAAVAICKYYDPSYAPVGAPYLPEHARKIAVQLGYNESVDAKNGADQLTDYLKMTQWLRDYAEAPFT